LLIAGSEIHDPEGNVSELVFQGHIYLVPLIAQ
jgi:hypothetical protein